jgi:uncharacterized protein (DUF58 family)
MRRMAGLRRVASRLFSKPDILFMLQLDADFLKRCEFYHRAAQRTWGRRFLARREELRLAGGTEVTGYTDYTSGNDLRYVDWNRCARHDELVVKLFQGNEDNYTYFLLDRSTSMRRGDGRKFATAQELSMALSYLALANLDCVGFAAFDNRLAAEHPAVRGKQRFPRIFNFIAEQSVEDFQPTDLLAAVETFVARGHRSGLAIVVSDGFDPRFITALDLLRRRDFEPYVLRVVDAFDEEPGILGGVRLNDVEAGRAVRQNIDETDLANYRQVIEEHRGQLRKYCMRHGIGLMHIRAETPVTQSLERIVQAGKT